MEDRGLVEVAQRGQIGASLKEVRVFGGEREHLVLFHFLGEEKNEEMKRRRKERKEEKESNLSILSGDLDALCPE